MRRIRAGSGGTYCGRICWPTFRCCSKGALKIARKLKEADALVRVRSDGRESDHLVLEVVLG